MWSRAFNLHARSSDAVRTFHTQGHPSAAIVERIVGSKAQFRSLAEPWADTGTSTGRLMLAVLDELPTWSAISSVPGQSRTQKPRQGPRKAHGAGFAGFGVSHTRENSG
jgi:hypothetical protein